VAEEKQKALIELLRGHKVYLQTHNFPDPDAISSAFGLKRYMELHRPSVMSAVLTGLIQER
jgi:nanoRNase/pAp phosphatase (c-di-AMP/oligoRNAs hydrolase)